MATVTVTLVKPHTHAGRQYPAGAELRLSPSDAKYLLDRKVIAKLPAVTSTTDKEAPHE
ncbi:hypothetical protein HA520_14980 [Azotobacter chroococcum]|uniref:DUF7210 domain-containing protein n=1 Tax=Azotobacter chroococcum TaxID=353 RepID=A0AA43Z844_9GAMM|nr:hypothetical protein [Azotobacter chroococcum]NHN78566.1 hypothetical protein [Azotobacter chroococcum]